jgi:hypothetical protein
MTPKYGILQGSIQQARINTCPAGLQGYAWMEKGYTYGHNDAGDYQSIFAVGFDADVDAAYLWFFTNGWECKVTRNWAGMSRLEAHAGWNGGTAYSQENFESYWEIDAEETDKALLEADFPQGISTLNLANPVSAQAVNAAVNDPDASWFFGGATPPYTVLTLTDGTIYYFDGGAQGPYDAKHIALPTADAAPVYSLFKLMANGVTSYQVESSRIKFTQIFSNLWQAQVSYNNVDRILTYNTMLNVEGAAEALFFGLPPVPTVTRYIETIGDLQYGWKKARPSIPRLALTKWKIVEVYQFGLWPVKLFGNPI